MEMMSMLSVEDWWLEEFRTLRQEWEVRTSHEQQLVNYSLLVLAAVLTFVGVGPFNALGGWRAPIVFALSCVFFSLGFFYLRHDIFIAYTSQFISEILVPKLRPRYGGSQVLRWQEYLHMRHGSGWRKWLGQLAAVVVCVLPIIGPGMALFILGTRYLLFVNFAGGETVSALQQAASWFGLCIGSGLIILDIGMGILCFTERLRTHNVTK